MNDLLIRRAQVADARAIARIHVESWRSAYKGIMPEHVLDGLSIDRREQVWTGDLVRGDRHILVAEKQGTVVGWVTFGSCRDRPREHDDQVDPPGEVHGIYIDPGWYGRGIGSALWSTAAARLAGLGFIRIAVWVLEANTRARRFYEKVGGQLDPQAQKVWERDGARLLEVRYWCPVRPTSAAGGRNGRRSRG